MFKSIAIASMVTGIATASVLGGFGLASAQAATPPAKAKQCIASFEWVGGQQKAAHMKSNVALRSNADAVVKYPVCKDLSLQMLNAYVTNNSSVKVIGKAVYTHWR